MPQANNLIVITGPTAIGKTNVAIQIAQALETEIISADSRQFFKEMFIGTAKPTAEELASVPHHLVGHLSVNDIYNISMFEQDVLAILNQLFKTKKYVVLTGGSGLYIDAVCRGIDDLPNADGELRGELNKRFELEGIESLQNELQDLDPDYFSEVDQNNPKRLMRAIEVCRTTGKKYSSLRKQESKKRDFNIVKIALNTERRVLFDRIHKRVDGMLQSGLVEEVRSLQGFKSLNALNTVGYKEIFNYLDGLCSLDEAIEKIKTNTRRYAKRQLTWFKKDPEYRWFEPGNVSEILFYIREKTI
jgi:tRNA dimethylallyltransferase